MYKNNYGADVIVSHSNYDIKTTDCKHFDKIINPFDLNTSLNYPYKDEVKNSVCFLEMQTEFENILVMFKYNEFPMLELLYEPYYDIDTGDYNVFYNFDLLNSDNQLVLMFGSSIIILDMDTYNVIKFKYSNKIKDFGINIFYRNGYYIVEDYYHNFIFFNDDLNEVEEENDIIKNIKMELIEESKKRYGWIS